MVGDKRGCKGRGREDSRARRKGKRKGKKWGREEGIGKKGKRDVGKEGKKKE